MWWERKGVKKTLNFFYILPEQNSLNEPDETLIFLKFPIMSAKNLELAQTFEKIIDKVYNKDDFGSVFGFSIFTDDYHNLPLQVKKFFRYFLKTFSHETMFLGFIMRCNLYIPLKNWTKKMPWKYSSVYSVFFLLLNMRIA